MDENRILYLSRRDVEAVNLPMPDIIQALEKGFAEKGKGRVEMPPKPGIHPRPDAFIHAMPAYIPRLRAAGIKWVSGFPGNQKKNLPYISGLIILNDPDTGLPVAVMDATWITAMRTGAATAVAARYLARRGSQSVGIIACGVQGRSNLLALASLFPLRQVKAYDLDIQAARDFVGEMGNAVDASFEVVMSPREATLDMDLVVTSGPIRKNPHPVIEAGWLKPGSFCSPVDFDSYFTGGAMRAMDKLATDDLNQLQYYRKVGYFQNTPDPFADLGEIVTGQKPGRQGEEERTMSLNLGLALDDMATALLVYRKALQHEIGTFLPR